MDKKFVVAIDCRMIESSGIGVFLRSFLYEVLNQTSSVLFKLILPYSYKFEITSPNIKLFYSKSSPFSFGEILGSLHKIINSADVFFSPNYNIPFFIKVPIVCVIHDVIYCDLPTLSKGINRYLRILALRRAYALSYTILTVSEFSKSRIISHLGNSKPVRVCYNALREEIINTNIKITNSDTIKRLVFVGNIKPHKGIKTLIQAFRYLDSSAYELVIVGQKDNFKTALENLEIDNLKIKFTGAVSDRELIRIMQSAYALIQPSEYEGFGIPPMEALYMGLPVVVSDISVFQEIYSDLPVVFFKVGSASHLASVIKELKVFDASTIEATRIAILNKYNSKAVNKIIWDTICQYKK